MIRAKGKGKEDRSIYRTNDMVRKFWRGNLEWTRHMTFELFLDRTSNEKEFKKVQFWWLELGKWFCNSRMNMWLFPYLWECINQELWHMLRSQLYFLLVHHTQKKKKCHWVSRNIMLKSFLWMTMNSVV